MSRRAQCPSAAPAAPARALPAVAFALLAALACAVPARAETIALTGATVHPVSAAAIPDGVVLVEGGRITAVGAGLAVPPGARVVDCRGKHIFPGLVSASTVLGLIEVMSVSGTNDVSETGTINPDIRAEVEFNPGSEILPVTLINGVTTALVIPRGGAISGTSAAMHLWGWNAEDMTLKAPVGLHIQWPMIPTGRMLALFPGSEEERARARERSLAALKQAFDDARAYWTARQAEGTSGIPRHDRDVKWEAMGKALRGEIPVFIHATALAQIKAALKFVDEQKLTNVVLVGGTDAWRVADELKQRNIPVVLNGILALPRHEWDPYDEAYTVPAKLRDAGLRFCISDGSAFPNFTVPNSRNLAYHAATAAAFGLTEDEALASVTLWPAQILGVDKQVGSLEPGKLADLVVADGDLLEQTTKVEQVWVNGQPVPLESRQTRLFQKYDGRPRGEKARAR